MDRVKRIWYLSPMRAAKVQASLRVRAVSPEPSLLTHISSESRGTFRQKARSLAPLNGWACAVKICHDGMLEDTNSLDRAQIEQAMGKTSNFQIYRPISHSILNCNQQLFCFFFMLVTKHSLQYGFGFRIWSRMSFTSAGLKNWRHGTEFSLTPNLEYFTPTFCLWLQLFAKSQ